jgi:hypothetical protein
LQRVRIGRRRKVRWRKGWEEEEAVVVRRMGGGEEERRGMFVGVVRRARERQEGGREGDCRWQWVRRWRFRRWRRRRRR